MINTLEEISKNLKLFETMAPYPLNPFWGHMMPDMDDEFWDKKIDHQNLCKQKLVFFSGPSRNGNHLLHSMMDNHPQLCRLPGEDSFLPALFNDMVHTPGKAIRKLRSQSNVEYILNLTGYGQNKWKALGKMFSEKYVQKTRVWAGVQKKQEFVSDYQDTVVPVEYSAFESQLYEMAEKLRGVGFLDLFKIYIDSLMMLDPEYTDRTGIPIYAGSGLRPELYYLFDVMENVKCIVPIRPFETYYFSFIKGKFKTEEIQPELIAEAWDHWKCKVFDYLLLKYWYPEKICIINFVHLIKNTEQTSKEICRFLDIDFSETCLVPTAMGCPTKGNSSFPKREEDRGRFYQSGLKKVLPEKFYPNEYNKLWNCVGRLSL